MRKFRDYLELKPTLSVSFLDHVLFQQVPDYHLRFWLLEAHHRLLFTDDPEFRTGPARRPPATEQLLPPFLRGAAPASGRENGSVEARLDRSRWIYGTSRCRDRAMPSRRIMKFEPAY
jgi:hypothetical protein